jgi:hypothetical protein
MAIKRTNEGDTPEAQELVGVATLVADYKAGKTNPQSVDNTSINVHNISNLPTIDYRTLKPLQGNLKDLDKINHDKLLRVLKKRGFTTPFLCGQTGRRITSWTATRGIV